MRDMKEDYKMCEVNNRENKSRESHPSLQSKKVPWPSTHKQEGKKKKGALRTAVDIAEKQDFILLNWTDHFMHGQQSLKCCKHNHYGVCCR